MDFGILIYRRALPDLFGKKTFDKMMSGVKKEERKKIIETWYK